MNTLEQEILNVQKQPPLSSPLTGGILDCWLRRLQGLVPRGAGGFSLYLTLGGFHTLPQCRLSTDGYIIPLLIAAAGDRLPESP